MDSEPSSKPIDSANSQTTENLKENVPIVNVNEDKEKNEIAADAVVVEIKDEKDSEKPETASEEQTTSTIVVTKKENDDKSSELQTTTTTIVTKKTTEDGETVETNTKETVVDTEAINATNEEVVQEKASVESTKTECPDSELESEESEEEDDEKEEEQKEKEKDDEKEEKEQEEEKKNEEEKEGQLVVQETQKLKVKARTDVENVEAIESKLEDPETQNEKDVPLEKKASNINLDINNQIENIISDIDISIRAQEKITQLKEQELQLVQKQKELANQIQQQQLLAQKLFAENQRKEQELREQELLNRNQYREECLPKATQQDLYEPKEPSNVSRTVDLRKIFTPATDAVEILPKNRKLYASSAFYSPTLHPTVEDQVELARRISHSLSDISNQTSKGQSMYVNRKKRSVKWVHEGCGQGEIDEIESQALCKENAEESLPKELTKLEKLPLKLIMNPHGQMRDYNSLKESINIKTGLLSPENCAELITALQLHKGRGAELFAKRRRKADNWVVDETNAGTHSPSGLSDYQPYKSKPASSPNLLPAYSDAGKHRVQLNIHQENLIEKYAKPGIQVVKSPWEAALQTGSASSAFVDEYKYGSQTPITETASPLNLERDVTDYPQSRSVQSDTTYGIPHVSNIAAQNIYKNDQFINPQRELAYKPSVAQGWGGRNVELPRGLYVPKEISLASYAPPPAVGCVNQSSLATYAPAQALGVSGQNQSSCSPHQETPWVDFARGVQPTHTGGGFPVYNVSPGPYNSAPPKQQFNDPASYQKIPPSRSLAGPQVNFNPSPLSFDKLSKFQEPNHQSSRQQYNNINKPTTGFGGVVRNTFPAGNENKSSFYRSSPQEFGGCHQLNSQLTVSRTQSDFNNCARGWKTTSNSQYIPYSTKVAPSPSVASNSLPYSDF